MYSSLHKIDISAVDKNDQRLSVQTDHRQAAEIEAERELSIAFALVRVLNALRTVPDAKVQYVAFDTPPLWFQQAVASAGGFMTEADDAVVEYMGELVDPYDLFDQTMGQLAQVVVAREGMQLDLDAVQALEGRYERAFSDPLGEEEIEYWTAVVEIAAVAAEVARQRYGGRWAKDTHEMSTLPFAFETPHNGIINIAGKVENFFEAPHRHRVSQLIVAVSDQSAPAGEERIMVSLKPADWPMRDQAYSIPIFEGTSSSEEPLGDVPIVVYGADMPQTFGTFMREADPQRDIDVLHADALENLAAIEVTIDVLDLDGLQLFVVSGDYFACEKVLDPGFMQQMHERVGTELLAVGVPVKGRMFVTNAVQDPQQILGFAAIVEGQFREGEGAPISPLPLLVSEGRIVGVLRLGEPET